MYVWGFGALGFGLGFCVVVGGDLLMVLVSGLNVFGIGVSAVSRVGGFPG